MIETQSEAREKMLATADRPGFFSILRVLSGEVSQ